MHRDPGLAPVLSVFVWGLGLLYLGRFWAFVFWLIAQGVAAWALAETWNGPWEFWIAIGVAALWLLQVWLALPASEESARARPETEVKNAQTWERFISGKR